MYNIAICEDNLIESKQIYSFVKSILGSDCEISVFESGKSLLQSMNEKSLSYHIVLMDIELKGESGIDTAESVNCHAPYTQIIFLTNYLDYATEVYEIPHLYYVYKKNMTTYLPKALKKALEQICRFQNQFLHFSYQKQLFQLPINDIRYMERILRTTHIHTGNSVLYTSEKFPALLERLPEYFFTCHRSFVVNLHYVTKFSRGGIQLEDNTSIPVGKKYDEMKQRYVLYMTSYSQLTTCANTIPTPNS